MDNTPTLTAPAELSTAQSTDKAIDALFKGSIMVPTPLAFKALGIQKTLGHDLINRGVLERVKIGRASRITVSSIKAAARNGVPPEPDPEEPPVPRFKRGT